jgi:small subunit ribosomal protein S5
MGNNFKKKNGAGREKSEFEQKLLDLARVARVVKGGRRFSFRATMVIGNRRGKVGIGVAKGSDVSEAINKAVAEAKKDMIEVKRKDASISFEVREKLGAAKVLIKPAKEGRGIVAGGAMRAVIDLAGIKNITAKSLGTSNKINVAKATIKALSRLEGKKINPAKPKDLTSNKEAALKGKGDLPLIEINKEEKDKKDKE